MEHAPPTVVIHPCKRDEDQGAIVTVKLPPKNKGYSFIIKIEAISDEAMHLATLTTTSTIGSQRADEDLFESALT